MVTISMLSSCIWSAGYFFSKLDISKTTLCLHLYSFHFAESNYGAEYQLAKQTFSHAGYLHLWQIISYDTKSVSRFGKSYFDWYLSIYFLQKEQTVQRPLFAK